MRVTVDDQGRLTIPAEVLHQAGFEPGQAVELDVKDHQITVSPDAEYPRLERRNGFPVIVSAPGTPPLSMEFVNDLINQLRDGERS